MARVGACPASLREDARWPGLLIAFAHSCICGYHLLSATRQHECYLFYQLSGFSQIFIFIHLTLYLFRDYFCIKCK